jgi:riboflavin kinase/FMN adenylyltransferase
LKIYRDISEIETNKRFAVAIGTFDGVHAGHRKILERLKQMSRSLSLESLVMTFEPHPRQVLQPDSGISLLTDIDEKLELLDELGIDAVYIQKFDKQFSSTSADDYIKKILVDGLKTAALVIGYDHHFGRNREGSFALLHAKSSLFGYRLEEIPAQDVDDVVVSSTKIRNALLNGDVHRAADFLTYPYTIHASVIEGKKLGRTIGFPTANLNIEGHSKLIPATGVYAVKIVHINDMYYGMLNIGYRPTVDNDRELKAEAHILNFSKDIYGEEIKIQFIERVRNELKFESLDKLAEQLQEDKRTVSKIFKL